MRTFYVHSLYQRQGIGTLLLLHIETVARKNGHTTVIVQAGPKGEPFYKKLGFIPIKSILKQRSGISYTDMFMEKHL